MQKAARSKLIGPLRGDEGTGAIGRANVLWEDLLESSNLRATACADRGKRDGVVEGNALTGSAVTVRNDQLWVIERCTLKADPVIRERLQEVNEVIDRRGISLQLRDAVDVRIEIINVLILEVGTSNVESHRIAKSATTTIVEVGTGQFNVAKRGFLNAPRTAIRSVPLTVSF